MFIRWPREYLALRFELARNHARLTWQALRLNRLEKTIMTDQEKINALTDAVKSINDELNKVAAEVQALKDEPEAEALDFTALEEAVANVGSKVKAIDDINEDKQTE